VRFSAFLTAFAAVSAVASEARADEGRALAIWYRSAEGCPDVHSFLSRLAARGVRAHSAEVGDAVDFVVTLGRVPGGSQGLLERQTRTGSVAIRTLDGDDCEQVADGIALGLVLASEDVRPAPAASAPSPPASTGDRTVDRGVETPSTPTASARGAATWLGAEGALMTGVVGTVVPGAAVFGEFVPSGRGFLGGGSLRVAAVGGTGSASVSGESIRTTLLFGRLEGCPVSARIAELRFSPCASFDLGEIGAHGSGVTSETSHDVWAALGVSARGEWSPAHGFMLSADVGALLPLTRYDVVASGRGAPLASGARFGVSASVGVGFRLP
jgi:hypothetical protein